MTAESNAATARPCDVGSAAVTLGTQAKPDGKADPVGDTRRTAIFKDVRQGRPYPDHKLSEKDWAQIPPQQVHLTELITTTTVLELDRLLAEDTTVLGDLFPHAVQWAGELFLEDGLHRALRAALQQRTALHVRVLDLDLLRS